MLLKEGNPCGEEDLDVWGWQLNCFLFLSWFVLVVFSFAFLVFSFLLTQHTSVASYSTGWVVRIDSWSNRCIKSYFQLYFLILFHCWLSQCNCHLTSRRWLRVNRLVKFDTVLVGTHDHMCAHQHFFLFFYYILLICHLRSLGRELCWLFPHFPVPSCRPNETYITSRRILKRSSSNDPGIQSSFTNRNICPCCGVNESKTESWCSIHNAIIN